MWKKDRSRLLSRLQITNNPHNKKIRNMARETKYEEAVEKLENIVKRLENDEMGIDEMTTELKKAQQLIKLCKDRLTKTDAEIQKILDNGKD